MKALSQFLCIALLLVAPALKAQELDARVDLNLSALSEIDRVQFQTFKKDLESYFNNYNWTTDYTGDRIRCAFQINIISANGTDFVAQLFVNSTRPLYKSDQVTTLAKFFDDALSFSYYRGQELQHGNNYRSLESVLDYYVYIILAQEYDASKRENGTPYYQQAQIVSVVANSAKGAGWERKTTSLGTFSRVGYIDDAMDANARAFRDLIFTYHYDGLDLLSTKPEEARVNVATVIDSLVTLRKESSAAGRSVFLRMFFETKYPELTDLARLFPDNINVYFQKLEFLDPVHANYYEDAKAKLSQ